LDKKILKYVLKIQDYTGLCGAHIPDITGQACRQEYRKKVYTKKDEQAELKWILDENMNPSTGFFFVCESMPKF